MRFCLSGRYFNNRTAISTLVFALGFLLTASALRAQDNHPPGPPGELSVSDITAHSARISWGPATDADADPLLYRVWLRKRIEGIAQPWLPPHETPHTALVWNGLSAGTLYEIKVAAFDGKVLGPARIRENAFTTLRDADGNHPPTTPRGMEFSEVGAHRVKIWWAASTDPDGDPITYQVALRKRIEGEVFEWLPMRSTTGTSMVWQELEAETLHDARVRASDGRNVSHWFLKERAFRTTPELHAPGKPGEITVSLVTATSARIAWGAATGPAGISLAYELQLRPRLDLPQEWRAVAETRELWSVAHELRPGTVYDVRVRAWAQGVAGAWAVKEEAFKTLAPDETNHRPSKPGPLEVSDLTPFSVRLSWGPSTDPDGDRVIYAVSLRKRVEGIAQPWSPARETRQPALIWDGLIPNTIYEVRIRAWDGKAFSDWFLKEHAFRTPARPDRLTTFVTRSDLSYAGDQRDILLVWPDDSKEGAMEWSDSVGRWTQCLEVMTDGTNNRARIPMSSDSGFFRIRR